MPKKKKLAKIFRKICEKVLLIFPNFCNILKVKNKFDKSSFDKISKNKILKNLNKFWKRFKEFMGKNLDKLYLKWEQVLNIIFGNFTYNLLPFLEKFWGICRNTYFSKIDMPAVLRGCNCSYRSWRMQCCNTSFLLFGVGAGCGVVLSRVFLRRRWVDFCLLFHEVEIPNSQLCL